MPKKGVFLMKNSKKSKPILFPATAETTFENSGDQPFGAESENETIAIRKVFGQANNAYGTLYETDPSSPFYEIDGETLSAFSPAITGKHGEEKDGEEYQ